MNSLELYQLWGNLYGHKELAACTSSFLVGKSQTLARSLESLYVKGILLPIKKKEKPTQLWEFPGLCILTTMAGFNP